MNPGQKIAVKNHLNNGLSPENKSVSKEDLCKNIGTTVAKYEEYENGEYIMEMEVTNYTQIESKLNKDERAELEYLRKLKRVI